MKKLLTELFFLTHHFNSMRLTILFVSILIIGTCSAIQFDLPHSVLKCFKENYKKGQAVHGDVHGANNDNTGINFYV